MRLSLVVLGLTFATAPLIAADSFQKGDVITLSYAPQWVSYSNPKQAVCGTTGPADVRVAVHARDASTVRTFGAYSADIAYIEPMHGFVALSAGGTMSTFDAKGTF